MKRLLATVALSMAAFGCAQSVHEASTVASADKGESKFDSYQLGVCETRRIKLDETPVDAGEVSEAEVRSRYAGETISVLHGEITAGRKAFTAPTTDSVFRSTNGVRLEKLPAWVVIRTGTHIAVPGGPPATSESEAAERPVEDIEHTAWADVIDSHTGVLVHGWSCASTVESGGKKTEYRGVDPDKEESREVSG